MRTQSKIAVGAFERAAIGGAFEVATNGVSDMNTIIPPAKINDLRRGQMATDKVELLWTAVGGSMNDGTGKHILLVFNILNFRQTSVLLLYSICGFAENRGFIIVISLIFIDFHGS